MSSPTLEQSGYLSTLEDGANMLQKAQTNLKKCPKQRLTEGYIKARLKSIDEYWDTLKQAHDNLTRCTPREQRGAIPYFLNEEYFIYEELYLNIKADLTYLLSNFEKHKIGEQVSMNIVHDDNQSPFAKLPRIQLPIFSGKYEDWPTYQDLFVALVHNTSISDVQKLHYLKTSVSGDAELLLRQIPVIGSNYKQAWEILKGRFGNKKIILNSILKRLFNQKKIVNQCASQMKALLDTTTECINSLNNLKISTDSWDPIIIFLVGQKLDTESLKDWEYQTYNENHEELPTWTDLKKFLESKFRTLELITPTSTIVRERPTSHSLRHVTAKKDELNILNATHASLNSQLSCTYCNGEHYIFNCKDFVAQPVEQRHEFVKKNHLCYNCLIPNHNVYRCKQKKTCRVCRRRHHSLLHKGSTEKHGEQSQPEQNVTTLHFSNEQPGHEVLLATAQVEVKSRNGETHILRALIDQGSEASFVSARVVELLGLTRTNINGVVSGVGEGNHIPIKHVVDLTVSSRFNKDDVLSVRAYILKSISTKLPSKHVTMNCNQLEMLPLADPTFYKPSKIDILLGTDVFCQIIEDGLVKLPEGIVAQKTRLGWILSGRRDDTLEDKGHNVITLHVSRMVTEDNNLLRKFWEIETEVYRKKKIYTKEEERCQEIYKNTTKRDDNGRYVVHLPLKQAVEETIRLCGDTKEQAIKRFMRLEKKFERDQRLKREYVNVMTEYREMGHMERSESVDDTKSVYLPHHAVIREDKDTTKVRVVYDASAKGSNGHSLNDLMMTGPVLQPDLRSLIIAWRTHKICVVGDIVKMYRMIKMTEEHTYLQRIFWRNNPEEELEIYNLKTVTFGTAAAPYLAVRTLIQLAEDESYLYPNTALVMKESFYMDDLMTGNENVEKTKVMCEEVRTILKKGGFEMQKWSSNSEEVLKYLQDDKCSMKDKIEIKLDKIIRILGLTWDRKDDKFKITVNLPEEPTPITKRCILSDVARLYDPFGWLAPIIINAKILIQRLWLCNLGWDEELPTKLKEEWIEYREELTHLQNIEVLRWFKTTCSNKKDMELHGFADASTQAHAAVTYLKVVEDGAVHVTMIALRTKVAPLKQISVLKLELCAAALLADLINDIGDVLGIHKSKIFIWTDSMVVLSWLQSHPSRWRTFITNRVGDITRVLDNSQWNHVQSIDNPADIATRGIKAYELATHEIWWTGPTWLKEVNFKIDKCDIPETDLEVKKSYHTKIEEKPIWERFSTITRMKRVLAYCKRFTKGRGREKYLTSLELETILEQCIKYYQGLTYGCEVEELAQSGKVRSRSTLVTLSPFLDEKGLLRVGGRLKNAYIAETSKHPLIIPSNVHITNLLISEAHMKTLHGGIQLMMTYIRTKYWVIGLKSAVKRCIRNCKTCIVDKAKVKYQLMGQLPAIRVNPCRPFKNSGVDYAGPVMIRTSKGRGHHAAKGYICLFVCMSTRAIHLEAVTDLTAQAFVAAYRRFVARRGHCSHLWSDNGTNFVGAAKELKVLFQSGLRNTSSEVAELLANDGTTWHFIPPRMPTHGGLWEAGVQSAKKHLARVNKDTKLTYEEMTTLLAQIEACLNSRPICQIDSTETPLTPGPFLVGEPLISVPVITYDNKNIRLLTRWQLIQRMTQDFWRRWQTEYLNTLQQRYKWQVVVPAPAIGDIVIVKEDDLPPTKWLLGKIKYLHPGTDNLVRVVTVQCKGNHELKRPLYKLIPLPKEVG